METNDKVIQALVEMGAIPQPGTTVSGAIRWQAVFLIGAAGSGKSFVKSKKYLKHVDFISVDPDEIKKTHPDYNPERPFELHPWSKEVAESRLRSILTSGDGSSVVVDGTGRNHAAVSKNIRMAQDNGYKTYLVYVYVPLAVSIYRNRNRDRFVPETKVLEQFSKINTSFRVLSQAADQHRTIINYERSELAKAEKDMEAYPPPQAVRPPRPGSSDYGTVVGSVVVIAARELANIAKRLKTGVELKKEVVTVAL